MHDDPAAAGSRAVADGPDPTPGARAVPDTRPHGPDGATPGAGTALGPGDAVPRRPFADRRDAGRALGKPLARRPLTAPLVLGLARGGVVVAAEVARFLGAPLDVLVVRKLGLPGQPELAMGAIAAVGDAVEAVLVESVLVAAGVGEQAFEKVCRDELRELRRREAAYRGDRVPVSLAGRDVVLVDDGLATGATMRAAVVAVRSGLPARVTVAVPVGAPRARDGLAALVDDVVCLVAPTSFRAVGQAYGDFAQTSDDEVRATLDDARHRV